MLDGAHRLALRGVAQGIVDDSQAPAVRDLAVAGLIQPVDGAWTLTRTGHAVLELEGGTDRTSGLGGGGSDVMAKVRAWFMT
jgi:hypothetical protein